MADACAWNLNAFCFISRDVFRGVDARGVGFCLDCTCWIGGGRGGDGENLPDGLSLDFHPKGRPLGSGRAVLSPSARGRLRRFSEAPHRTAYSVG